MFHSSERPEVEVGSWNEMELEIVSGIAGWIAYISGSVSSTLEEILVSCKCN